MSGYFQELKQSFEYFPSGKSANGIIRVKSTTATFRMLHVSTSNYSYSYVTCAKKRVLGC